MGRFGTLHDSRIVEAPITAGVLCVCLRAHEHGGFVGLASVQEVLPVPTGFMV